MAKFVELLLSALQFQAEGLLEIGDIVLSTPAETRRWLHHIPTYERRWFKTNWAEAYRGRQQFYRTLNYLKRQGLVVKKGVKRHALWVITKRGKERIQYYKRSRLDLFSASRITFAPPRGGGVTIVAFDIPEKERRKRDWLRMCLAEMDFEKLQKSVWVGKGAVDENFIHALRERDLSSSVHIFAVTQRGTINPIATG